MKQLLCKVWSLFRRFYFHLSVILTLGIRDGKSKEKESGIEESQKGNTNGC